MRVLRNHNANKMLTEKKFGCDQGFVANTNRLSKVFCEDDEPHGTGFTIALLIQSLDPWSAEIGVSALRHYYTLRLYSYQSQLTW